MTTEQEYIQGTVFNSSVACLQRLGEALRDCLEYSKASTDSGFYIRYLNLWNRTLLTGVFNEIAPHISEEETKTILRLFNEYYKLPPLMKKNNRNPVFHNEARKVIDRTAFLKRWLKNEEIEFHLRKLATKYGMLLTKDKDDPRRALG